MTTNETHIRAVRDLELFDAATRVLSTPHLSEPHRPAQLVALIRAVFAEESRRARGGLSVEQAREHAGRWADWKTWALARGTRAAYEGPWDPHGEEGSERDRLESWVRARMAAGHAVITAQSSSRNLPDDYDALVREELADDVGAALGLSKGDGTKATAYAWVLCEQAGWPL